MEKFYWWGGTLSLSTVIAVFIAKAQTHPAIWYAWVLNEPHVIPSLIGIMALFWILAIGQHESPGRVYWKVFSWLFPVKTQQKNLSRLRIHKALFGSGPRTDRDVTESLQSFCSDSLDVVISYQLLIGNDPAKDDPAPGEDKRILVEYSFGGGPHFTAIRPQSMRLILPEDPWLLNQVVEIQEIKSKEEACRAQNTELIEHHKAYTTSLTEQVKKAQRESETYLKVIRDGEESVNRLAISINALEKEKKELREQLEDSTIPRVVPVKYLKAQTDALHQYGIVLHNDGAEPAHDVSIEPFLIGGEGGWLATFQEVYRLAKGEDQTTGVQISGRNTGLDLAWPFEQFLKQEMRRDPETHDWVVPPPTKFGIVYRDHNGKNWYRSNCEVGRDVLNYGGLYVRFLSQEKLAKPPHASSATEAL